MGTVYTGKTRTIEIGASKFIIRNVPPLKVTEIVQECRIGKDDINVFKFRVLTLEYGLVGWSDVSDEDGNDLPFDKKHIQGLDQETLDGLEKEFNAIYRKNEEEVKN